MKADIKRMPWLTERGKSVVGRRRFLVEPHGEVATFGRVMCYRVKSVSIGSPPLPAKTRALTWGLVRSGEQAR